MVTKGLLYNEVDIRLWKAIPNPVNKIAAQYTSHCTAQTDFSIDVGGNKYAKSVLLLHG